MHLRLSFILAGLGLSRNVLAAVLPLNHTVTMTSKRDEMLAKVSEEWKNALAMFLASKGVQDPSDFIAENTPTALMVNTDGAKVTKLGKPPPKKKPADEEDGETEEDEGDGETEEEEGGGEEGSEDDENVPEGGEDAAGRRRSMEPDNITLLLGRADDDEEEEEEDEGDDEDDDEDDDEGEDGDSESGGKKKKKDDGADRSMITNDIYNLLDRIPLRRKDDDKPEAGKDWSKKSDQHFSVAQISWINALNDAFNSDPPSKKDDKKMDKDVADVAENCQEKLPAGVEKSLEDYIDNLPDKKNVKSAELLKDPKYLEAAAEDSELQLLRMRCRSSQSIFQTDARKIYGDDFWMVSAAMKTIVPITSGTQAETPGVTMKLGSSDNQDVSGQGAGNVVPLYELRGLVGTVASFRKAEESGNGRGRFTTTLDSKKSDSTTESSSSKAGAKIAFSKFSIGANGGSEEKKSMLDVQTVSMSASWYGAIVEAGKGSWFDDFRTAEQTETYKKKDKKDKREEEAIKAFDEHYGTQEEPGPAALYVDKVVLIYRPRISVEFRDQKEYKSMKKESGSAGFCFIICFGASGSKEKSEVKTSDEKRSMEYEDVTDAVYIIGIFAKSYWQRDKSTNDDDTNNNGPPTMPGMPA